MSEKLLLLGSIVYLQEGIQKVIVGHGIELKECCCRWSKTFGAEPLFTPAAPVGVVFMVGSGAINVVNFVGETTGLLGQNEQGENKDLFEATGDLVTGVLDWASGAFKWGW